MTSFDLNRDALNAMTPSDDGEKLDAQFHDTNNLTRTPTTYLFVGVAGDVAVEFPGGGLATYKNVGAGTYLMVRVVRIDATLTTASEVIGHY